MISGVRQHLVLFHIVDLICYSESLFIKDLLDIRIIRPFKRTRCSGNIINTSH
jgi:hypothetical protein